MSRLSYKVVAAGIDTIEVNGYGLLFDHMPTLLDALQEAAIAERDAKRHRKKRKEVRIETPWQLCGQPLMMAAHGVGEGQYRWYMTCPAAIFRVAQHNMNDITVKVRLSSTFLWEHGYRKAWELVVALLVEWGEFQYQPSEVHLCSDVAGYPLERLRIGDFTRRGHVVRWHQEDAQIIDLQPSRAAQQKETTRISVRYGEQEGISFSPSSPHSVVIYNKPREIRYHSPEKAWFGDIWRGNGWNGIDAVTRIEVRYERQILHEMGIETMETLFDQMDSMWAYSTQQWLRHTRPSGDLQRSRWPTSAWWKAVQVATFERADAAPAQRQKIRDFNDQRILSTILGYMESWAAWHNEGDEVSQLDISTVLRDIATLSDDHYLNHETDFQAEVQRKRKALGFSA